MTRLGSGRPGAEIERELDDLREQLRRYRVYLGAALALLGLGTLLALGLVGFFAFRLAESVNETQELLAKMDEATAARTDELRRGLDRQEQELTAIRKAANEDLQAMQEAHRKLAAVRDPEKELGALREANEALWTELAKQRAQLLEAIHDREAESAAQTTEPPSRFQLGETSYVDPKEEADEIKGFIKGDEKVYLATNLPANPAALLIEVSPEEVSPGEPYQLSVRLVNRSNRPLEPTSLRLDWSFQGKNTGGDVPVGTPLVDAQKTALLYSLSGQWTEAHQGPVSLTATLTINGGARLRNTLRW